MIRRPSLFCLIALLLGTAATAACGSSSDSAPAPNGGPVGGSGGSGGAGGSGGSGASGQGGEDSGTQIDGNTGGAAGADGAAPDTYGPDAPPEDGSQVTDGGTDDSPTGNDAQPSLHPDCDRLVAVDAQLASAANDYERAAAAEQFVLDVVQSDGFPIRCGDTFTFVFEAPAGFGVPSVVGDFNSWDPSAGTMSAIGGAYFRADLTIDTAPNRYLYKFTNGQVWVPDPRARRFGYDQYGEYSLVNGGLLRGHLERHLGVAGAGLAPRSITVYLPPGYESSSDTYPVLYAHDGQNLFDPEAMWGGWHLDEAVEDLLSQGAIQPFVIAGIHNTAERMDEYTHVQDVLSGQTVGGKAEAYFSLIATRVMPLMAAHYRVKTGPANTWTMGSSLGGLISLYFGMKHPDIFGRVAGLSSTSGWGSIGAHNQTILELLPTLAKPAAIFYLDSGGNDGGPPGCVDTDNDGIDDDNANSGDNYCENIQLRDVFAAQGFVSNVEVFHWWETDAEHNEAAWAARVFRPLEILAAP